MPVSSKVQAPDQHECGCLFVSLPEEPFSNLQCRGLLHIHTEVCRSYQRAEDIGISVAFRWPGNSTVASPAGDPPPEAVAFKSVESLFGRGYSQCGCYKHTNSRPLVDLGPLLFFKKKRWWMRSRWTLRIYPTRTHITSTSGLLLSQINRP